MSFEGRSPTKFHLVWGYAPPHLLRPRSLQTHHKKHSTIAVSSKIIEERKENYGCRRQKLRDICKEKRLVIAKEPFNQNFGGGNHLTDTLHFGKQIAISCIQDICCVLREKKDDPSIEEAVCLLEDLCESKEITGGIGALTQKIRKWNATQEIQGSFDEGNMVGMQADNFIRIVVDWLSALDGMDAVKRDKEVQQSLTYSLILITRYSHTMAMSYLWGTKSDQQVLFFSFARRASDHTIFSGSALFP